jgi:hypothetical protein
MTDHLKGFIITLEENLSEDDAQPIFEAIRQLRGVLSVHPNVADTTDLIAYERARHELRTKILGIIWPKIQ